MKSIFVSIASYRDKLCLNTLSEVFTKATHPERIFAGVCQQNKEDDLDCVNPLFEENNPLLKPFINNIRIIRMRSDDARGPTFARYLCTTLYNNEDYFCQLDSHLRIHPNWDELCIGMIENIKANNLSQKPVLSYYSKAWEDYPENGDFTQVDATVSHMCKAFYSEDKGLFSFKGAEIKPSPPLPTRQPFVAGGFVFAEGEILREVPFDPTLDYIFVGEEIMLSARFFTHGYDVFNPNVNVVFHLYTRAKEDKIWKDKVYSDTEAVEKIKRVLQMKTPYWNDYSYGMGKVRTLEEFYQYTGLSPTSKEESYNFCDDKFQAQLKYKSAPSTTATSESLELVSEEKENVFCQYLIYGSIAVVFIIILISIKKNKNTQQLLR